APRGSLLNRFQIVDEPRDHRVDARPLALLIGCGEIVEAYAPHRHFARSVRRAFLTPIDRAHDVFSRELAAVAPCDAREIRDVRVQRGTHRPVALAGHAVQTRADSRV